MTEIERDERQDVGWCHHCGTMQLKEDMPTKELPWTDRPEPVCFECGDEPWGLGVWRKGTHSPACVWTAAARSRVVEWTPAWACSCGGLPADEY